MPSVTARIVAALSVAALVTAPGLPAALTHVAHAQEAQAAPATAPPVPGGAWLDVTPPPSWNRQGAAVPKPASIDGEPLGTGRCAGQSRAPETPGDQALVAAGWTLVGPLQLFGEVSLATAASAADGMCRPLGFQAFVFVRGRFAGTLAPQPTDARTDGAITDARLLTRDRVMATYARYAADDALCCPSRTSRANFTITRSPGGSVLAVESVTTEAAARP